MKFLASDLTVREQSRAASLSFSALIAYVSILLQLATAQNCSTTRSAVNAVLDFLVFD